MGALVREVEANESNVTAEWLTVALVTAFVILALKSDHPTQIEKIDV